MDFVAFENGKYVECLIDTGFSGPLCLPLYLAAELGLEIVSEVEICGVGQHREMVAVAVTNIVWFGNKIETEVLFNNGDDRLLGSELLADKTLTVNYKKSTVVIKEKELL